LSSYSSIKFSTVLSRVRGLVLGGCGVEGQEIQASLIAGLLVGDIFVRDFGARNGYGCVWSGATERLEGLNNEKMVGVCSKR
jgi:hypothetical protein